MLCPESCSTLAAMACQAEASGVLIHHKVLLLVLLMLLQGV